MRPLDPLTSIKTKLGAIIAGSVGVALIVLALGLKVGISFAVAGIASGFAALAMVQFLARGMTSPLREMARAAMAMAGGDYSRRVTSTSRDEVGELARAFNAMSTDLEEADRMRRDLIANVSHELRTPISGLQAVLENLIDGVTGSDPSTFMTMLKQVERLAGLVEQLLDLSRLEAGGVPLDKRLFSVRDLFQDAVDECVAKERVQIEVVPPDLRCMGDPEKIHQVIANLLDNAVRHSPDLGLVTMSAEARGGGITIEVSDDGPGISRDEASRVFERFYRSDAARSPSGGGSGLGLAIARWIVDLHGGRIWVDQERAHGCRMVVELP
ncbi:MAG: ATP-binding protein [Actinomycetota bacterium]